MHSINFASTFHANKSRIELDRTGTGTGSKPVRTAYSHGEPVLANRPIALIRPYLSHCRKSPARQRPIGLIDRNLTDLLTGTRPSKLVYLTENRPVTFHNKYFSKPSKNAASSASAHQQKGFENE
jgi:hypothetical protein